MGENYDVALMRHVCLRALGHRMARDALGERVMKNGVLGQVRFESRGVAGSEASYARSQTLGTPGPCPRSMSAWREGMTVKGWTIRLFYPAATARSGVCWRATGSLILVTKNGFLLSPSPH